MHCSGKSAVDPPGRDPHASLTEQPLLGARRHGAGASEVGGRPLLLENLEASVVERRPLRLFDPDAAVAPAEPQELKRPVVAKRIVPPLAEKRVGGPRAAPEALVGVVASVAVTPELGAARVAREPQRLRALPDVGQSRVADVAAHVAGARKGGASLDGAVRFDADDEPSRAARSPATQGELLAKERLVGPVVPQIVSRPYPQVG